MCCNFAPLSPHEISNWVSDFFDANFETFFRWQPIIEMLTITWEKERQRHSETSKEHYGVSRQQWFQDEQAEDDLSERQFEAGAGAGEALRVFQFEEKDTTYNNEEFDPGSGWTLATGLTHASRGAAWR